jgi:hypothetical protein
MRMSSLASVAAAGFVASCAMAGESNPLTSFAFGGAHLQYGSDVGGDPDWLDYPTITPNVTAEGGIDGLHMFSPGEGSRTFTLGGSDYLSQSFSNRGNRLLLTGTGTINSAAWQHPADFIRTTFQFDFGFSTGSLAIYEVSTGFTLTDPDGNFITGVGSSTGFDPFAPGGYGLGFAFEDRFGGDITGATRFSWTVAINFDWTGMDSNDSLHFDISPNSIDFNTLPTPGAAALLGLGGMVAGRRTRKA